MNVRSRLCLGVVFSFFLASIAYARVEEGSSIGRTSEATDGNEYKWMTIKNDADPLEKSRDRWYWIQRFDALQNEEQNEEQEEQNCTKRSIEEFPDDLFTDEQRRHGAVLLHAFFGFYCFVLTAYVCNDYLLPSLDCICSGMNISGDVAGATFLATANCFPELFVNVVGTFLTESDLGVGTVVGGAVFNTFATPAFGALSALHGIQLEWRILSRDCLLYVMSVGTLVIIMWDGLVVWYEAVILMVLFVGYLILLFCSKRLIEFYRKVTHRCFRSTHVMEEKPAVREDDPMSQGLYKPFFHNELIAEYRRSCTRSSAGVLGLEERGGKPCQQDESECVEPDTPFVWPQAGILGKIWFLLTWPIKLVLFVTIPDCRYDRCRGWYPLTFVMCVVWIAISSYLTSWMMTVVGDTLGIADSIMGITFLSAGGNMPELVSIVILSRQGNGDMAMSNTLGANTLDILLCLGLPWTIKTIATGKNVEIISGALMYSVLSIIFCVIAFYSVIAFCKFMLNKTVGVICLILYAIFLTFAILIELNVFFFVNLPMCDHST